MENKKILPLIRTKYKDYDDKDIMINHQRKLIDTLRERDKERRKKCMRYKRETVEIREELAGYKALKLKYKKLQEDWVEICQSEIKLKKELALYKKAEKKNDEVS